LRTASQFSSSDVDELLGWTREMLDWPVIVKPPASVASDHVYCCQNSDQLRKAADSILGETNILGASNTAVVVQEFLEGTEYAVDMVSVDARPKLTAVWQYHRPADTGEFICYDAMRLLPYDGRRQASLCDYVFDVLKALGIRFGPSHCELIWRKDGPVLVEIGARLSGGKNAVLSRICGGISQLDETVSAVLSPETFLDTLDAKPELQQHAANVFLLPQTAGKLVRTRHLEDLRALSTLHSMSVATRRGDTLKRVAGMVTLIDSDPRAIDRDIGIIRSCERDGIFEFEEWL
jgi:biotin carboxylase